MAEFKVSSKIFQKEKGVQTRLTLPYLEIFLRTWVRTGQPFNVYFGGLSFGLSQLHNTEIPLKRGRFGSIRPMHIQKTKQQRHIKRKYPSLLRQNSLQKDKADFYKQSKSNPVGVQEGLQLRPPEPHPKFRPEHLPVLYRLRPGHRLRTPRGPLSPLRRPRSAHRSHHRSGPLLPLPPLLLASAATRRKGLAL